MGAFTVRKVLYRRNGLVLVGIYEFICAKVLCKLQTFVGNVEG